MRKIIQTLTAYDPQPIKAKIFLHANEVNRPLSLRVQSQAMKQLNRYPDHQGQALKATLAKVYGYDPETLMIGSGSSELLELMVKTFIDPQDTVLSLAPTFVMYAHYTKLHGGQYIAIADSPTVLENLYQASLRYHPKLIFISNPNNPTGSYLPPEGLRLLIQRVQCPVVVDEAYIEYVSDQASLASLVNQFPNLYVTRTFSKAYALAGARLGYLVTQKQNIARLTRAKTPYSVSHLSLALGIEALRQKAKMQTIIQTIITTRDMVYQTMKQLGIKVYPSAANFLYCHEPHRNLYSLLLTKGILIRQYEHGYYRISIGTKKEMTDVIQILKEIYHD